MWKYQVAGSFVEAPGAGSGGFRIILALTGRGEKRERQPKAVCTIVFCGGDARAIACTVFCRRFRDGLDESQRQIGDFFDARAVTPWSDGEVEGKEPRR